MTTVSVTAPCSVVQWGPEHLGVRRTATSGTRTLIYRSENKGMDIGSHNVTFGYFKHTGRIRWEERRVHVSHKM